MQRHTRYQGAILRDHHILLLKHRDPGTGREYLAIPGGGMQEGETEEACLLREMEEETHLLVRIERLLLDEAGIPDGMYARLKTYLCTPLAGEARPGVEPELAINDIVDLAWFDLRNEQDWNELIRANAITYSLLRRIQAVLGYHTQSAVSTPFPG